MGCAHSRSDRNLPEDTSSSSGTEDTGAAHGLPPIDPPNELFVRSNSYYEATGGDAPPRPVPVSAVPVSAAPGLTATIIACPGPDELLAPVEPEPVEPEAPEAPEPEAPFTIQPVVGDANFSYTALSTASPSSIGMFANNYEPNAQAPPAYTDAAPAGEMSIAAGTDVAMSSGPANTAFVFIKPHAVTDAVKSLVSSTLEGRGFTIVTQGELKSEVIDEKKLIDQHYYAIASKATILTPDQLNVPADKFEAQFGLGWADALATGRVMNAMDGCKALGLDADGLDAEWGKAKKAKKLVKFGGGFYCGLIEIEGKEPHWIFNGFFMSMRSKFTVPGECIYYYVVEWDAGATPWSDFRGKVLGPTDPADAPTDSLRGLILKDWEALGLKHLPNVGDNGVHASASPFEALAERNNWLSASFAEDPFGGPLLKCGVSEATIKAWSVDPQVVIDGSKGSLFDSVEDMDTGTCLEKLLSINAENQ